MRCGFKLLSIKRDSKIDYSYLNKLPQIGFISQTGPKENFDVKCSRTGF